MTKTFHPESFEVETMEPAALEAVSKSWFSWHFAVLAGKEPVADLEVASAFREKGHLRVLGKPFLVYREGLLSGNFILEKNGTILAEAEKPNAFLRELHITSGQRSFVLKAASPITRKMVLFEDSRRLGSISPQGFLSRRATLVLPPDLPLPFRVFLLWLTLMLWKRSQDNNA